MSKDQAGHRQRLRQKCDDKGTEALTDQELFELILFSLLPRIDTKPIVKTCFKRFHNFAGILSASEAELWTVKGLGGESARQIKLMANLLNRVSFERIKSKSVLSNWQNLQFTVSKSYLITRLKPF